MSSWLLLVFLTFCVAVKSEAQLDDSTYSRYSEFAASSCKSREFRCKNNQCISSDLVCDGAANCWDGSDESAAECSRSDLAPCGPRAYRCKYGACVDGDARCNNVIDCVDGSDEAGCPSKSAGSSGGGGGGGCRKDQFKCDSGQCVARTALCDGRVDCRDRSDESLDHCRDFECPDYAFQCRYGGCIDRDLKCNDQINCADGSDEDYELCGKATPTVVGGGAFRPNRPTNNNNNNNNTNNNNNNNNNPNTSNNGNNSSSSSSSSGGSRQPTARPPPAAKEACDMPSQPENGEWRLDRSLCPSRRPCFPEPGVRELPPGTQLVFSCNDGFKINGTKDVFCGLQGKWSAMPKCVEIKCPALSSAAVEAKCTSDNGWVSCESPTPVKTVARISCRNSYVPDTTDLIRRDNVKCNAKGEWEPSPIKCVSVCGVASTGTVAPLIVNGTRAKIGEFPWHATLYRLKNDEKQFICGATIIRENLLVTAAHCVYDEVTKRVDTPSKYYVAAGNIFRDYDYELHDQRVVKKAQVKDIFIVCNYLGLEGNYASDIAVLQIVKPFTFSSVIMPVCLDVGSVGEQAALEAGNLGRVAGFGRTASGDSSFILQTLTVPYVSLNTCKSSSIASASVRYITMDKFCAGYHNGSSVCDGDSGGGLVFQTDNKWYLRGIVSVGIGTTNVGAVRTCNSYSYSLYTRVSSHMDWIQDIILRVDTSRPTRPCT